MGYLVLIGVIIVVLCICVSANHSKKNRRLSQRHQPYEVSTNRQSSQPLIEQINWNDNNNNNFANQLTWVELKSESEPNDDFLNPNTPDDLDNILSDVIGTKDPFTQEQFEPRQKVYLCRRHRLAYHEDTWREIGCKCTFCGNSTHTALYVLPTEGSS